MSSQPFSKGFCLLLLAVLLAAGCARQTTAEDKLMVFAASSLREAFVALGQGFENTHPGVKIAFQFAGSQQLRSQLEHGAQADVFASADRHHMLDTVVQKPTVFARNTPVLIVANDSAAAVRRFADLAHVSSIVLGAKEVPIGRYSQQILERAENTLGAAFRKDVEARVVSRELNVSQVVSKVRFGEAQAALVYATDARAAKIQSIEIPPEINVVAEYFIAVAHDAPHATLAHKWVDFVVSPSGQRTLQAVGFLPCGQTP